MSTTPTARSETRHTKTEANMNATKPKKEPWRIQATSGTPSYSEGERISLYGNFAVYAPYGSCDGVTSWTVQTVDPTNEPEDMGYIIGEFESREDALLFAQIKARGVAPGGEGGGNG